jgi:hypothetical protein
MRLRWRGGWVGGVYVVEAKNHPLDMSSEHRSDVIMMRTYTREVRYISNKHRREESDGKHQRREASGRCQKVAFRGLPLRGPPRFRSYETG